MTMTIQKPSEDYLAFLWAEIIQIIREDYPEIYEEAQKQ